MSDSEYELDINTDVENTEDPEEEVKETEIKYADIIGYDNYIIYEDGRVFNKKFGRFLKLGLNSHGYLHVILYKNNKAKNFNIHRLVAQYFIPNPGEKTCVDHINGIKTDNRIENLRWASYIENGRNSKTSSKNSSGEKNVSWHKKTRKWRVQFKVNGKNKYFGLFSNYEDAVNFARLKRVELFGEFANHD